MLEIGLSILGGLVLFLFAVTNLSETFQKVLGDRAKQWILKFTGNTASAVLTGVVVTTLLDSSSAVIILTIVFVNAGLLSLRQAMGVVLGANIGTTISSQIIAMDVAKFSPVLLAIGFAFMLISKSEKLNQTGKIILYFGVLFFGLFIMENAVEPLKSSPAVVEYLRKADHPFSGAMMGAFVTLIIQSSSATVGMAILLAKKGLLSLAGAVAVMLGAELGTCSDTLLATIKGSRKALKTGLFHLFFNIISIALGLALFYPFLELVKTVSGQAPIERAVANAHMLFNITGVLTMVLFLPVFEKFLEKILPEKLVKSPEVPVTEVLTPE